MSQTVTWSGYTFQVFGTNTTWNDVSGIYIFTYQTTQGWRACYIGQADSFSTRLPNHERWAEAARSGATHVHALVVSGATDRDAIERAFIGTFQPPLNVHHR